MKKFGIPGKLEQTTVVVWPLTVSYPTSISIGMQRTNNTMVIMLEITIAFLTVEYLLRDSFEQK